MHTRELTLLLGLVQCESELLGLGVNWILETRDCDKTAQLITHEHTNAANKLFIYFSKRSPHQQRSIPKELSQTKIFDPGPRIT